MDEVQAKMQQSHDEQKEATRRQLASESEFEKQKALYEQKIEFINNRCVGLEAKEKELVQELKDMKRDVANQSMERKSKFETQIRDLTKKIEELNETLFETQSNLTDAEQRA